MANDARELDPSMDRDGLYREEMFTDRRVGTLQRLTPVSADGEPDPSRGVLFLGQTQVLTPAGALPINFEIEAATLGEAIDKFGDGARAAIEDTMRRIEEMRRDAASSIIVPDAGGGAPGGGMPGGGVPGGGGIRMP
jgi:hypothetical protein